MQNKPSKWVPGFKHSPRSSNTQAFQMGLFLNVPTGKFEPIDSSWDNVHSGGLFISGANKIYFRDETNKDTYINSPADDQLALYASTVLIAKDTDGDGTGLVVSNLDTNNPPLASTIDMLEIGTVFGTADTYGFRLKYDGDTNNFEVQSGNETTVDTRMVIERDTGNVGIGTASPASNQGFSQTIETNNTTSGFDIMLGNSSAGTDSFLGQLSANRGDECLSAISFKTDGSTDAGNIQFQTQIAGGALAIKQTISSAGAITAPLQPAFNAYVAATQSNIAINTEVVVQYNTDSGLGYDQGGDYNTTTYTFTAPVDGRYLFTYFMRLSSVDSAVPQLYTVIVTSNANYEQVINPDTMFSSDVGTHTANNSTMADMDASDTAFIRIYQAGGTAQMDITGNTYSAYFSGTLIC